MEQIAINILPKGAKPVCHSSQFDEGRQIMFKLLNDATPYTLSGTETISVLVCKPDGAEVVDSVTNTSDSYVVWDVSADACELSGVCECELSIVENGIVLGSKNFTMKVEEDAYGGRTIEVRTASGAIATFSTNMVEPFKSLKSDINPVQDLHGYSKPWSGGGGKNKLDYLSNLYTTASGLAISATSDGAIHYEGTTINSYCILTRKFNLSIPSGTTITVSRDVSVNYQHYFDFTFTDDSIEYVRIMPNTTSTTYTLPKDLKSIDIVCLGLTVGAAYNETVKFQLEYGSQATSWEPYSNICPISGFSALNVTRTGKNLADFLSHLRETDYGLTISATSDGAIHYEGTATQGYCQLTFPFNLSIPSGTTITVSRDVSLSYQHYFSLTFTDNSVEYVRIMPNTTSTTYTLPKDLKSIDIVCLGLTVGAAYNETVKFMIELGNQATTFEPYNGQTVTVNFGQTVYGGVADVTNGKVYVAYAKKKINELTWNYVNIAGSERFYSTSLSTVIEKPATIDTVSTLKCSCYETVTERQYAQFTINNIIAVQTTGFIVIRDTNYTSVSDLLNAVGEQEICYPLATPTEITTTPENLTAISGENNVYGDTNGDTEVEYYIEV